MHHRPQPLERRWLAVLGVPALMMVAQAQVLAPQNDEHRVAHILRRSSFGPLPGQAAALATPFPSAIVTHIDQQLTGTVAEDPTFATRLAQFGVPADPSAPPNFGNWGIRDLAAQNLYRMIYSNNQLNELLTMFWQQTLSTNYGKLVGFFNKNTALTSGMTGVPAGQRGAAAAAYCEFLQNHALRTNALGTFRDLLEASAKSPAMLIYLDSQTNDLPPTSTDRPNENYAREFFELHTLGVSPFTGFAFFYSYPDIQKASHAWTGWKMVADTTTPPNGVVTWKFQFDGLNHTDANGMILANPFNDPTSAFDFSLPGRTGLAQGEDLIDHIANTTETKLFICSRLIEFFIGFRPAWPVIDPYYQAGAISYPTGLPDFETELILLLGNCFNAWGTDGDIAAVVEMILKSTLMQDDRVFWSAGLNHVEHVARMFRSLTPSDPVYSAGELTQIVDLIENDCNQKLFRFPSPDGYPIHTDEQLSTSSYNYRLAIARTIDSAFVHPDPTGVFGGYAPGELNWYPLRAFQPDLYSVGTPQQKIFTLMGYLTAYPAIGSSLDLGSDAAVADHVLDLLYQGHVHAQTRTMTQSFVASLQATNPALAGTTLAQLVPASSPALSPSWYTIFTEVGHRLVQLATYATELPQAQLK